MEKKQGKSFLKRHWPEFALGGLVAAISIAAICYFSFCPTSTPTEAVVTLGKQTILTIELDDSFEKEYSINGSHTEMKLKTKGHSICVSYSGCPSQHCVNQGYVSSSNVPIVCAYNEVTISLRSASSGEIII